MARRRLAQFRSARSAAARVIRAACVCIHDVTPATWPACERLLTAVAMGGDIPVTLLLAPGREAPPAWFPRMLAARVARGDEVALCEAPLPKELWRGRAWFHRHGLPLRGFVPAEWRISRSGWSALLAQGFQYTATRRQFHLLAPRADFPAPCAVYRASTRLGLAIAMLRNGAHARPLARISLHPQDAHVPAVIGHALALLEDLLAEREPMTMQGLAQALRTGRYPRRKPAFVSAPFRRRSSGGTR